MHQPIESLAAREEDALAMRQMIMSIFCEALRTGRQPPMEVLEQVAAALGSVYREVAEAHCPPERCPCGWQPSTLRDISRLQSALGRTALSDHQRNLALSPVAGHG